MGACSNPLADWNVVRHMVPEIDDLAYARYTPLVPLLHKGTEEHLHLPYFAFFAEPSAAFSITAATSFGLEMNGT